MRNPAQAGRAMSDRGGGAVPGEVGPCGPAVGGCRAGRSGPSRAGRAVEGCATGRAGPRAVPCMSRAMRVGARVNVRRSRIGPAGS